MTTPDPHPVPPSAAAPAAPPPNWHYLAWQGFSLWIPATWNLTFYRHEDQDGAIALSDLRQVRLEIRWQTLRPKQIPRHLNRLLRRLQKKGLEPKPLLGVPPSRSSRAPSVSEGVEGGEPSCSSCPSLFIPSEGGKPGSLCLLPAATRIYELTWPGQPQHLEEILTQFADHTAAEFWPWHIYSIAGRVPRRLPLRKASLQPGATRLDFSRRGLSAALGAWSLADRLLGGQSVPQWAAATIPLVKHNPRGSWSDAAVTPSESPPLPHPHTPIPPHPCPCHTFQVRKRLGLLRRPRVLTLTLRHDPASNTLRWCQTTQPPAHRVPIAETL